MCNFLFLIFTTIKMYWITSYSFTLYIKKMYWEIDQFRYIKIQPNTIDLSTRLWGINPTNSVIIPQSLVLRSIVLGWILIYRNWSIIVMLPLWISTRKWIRNSVLLRQNVLTEMLDFPSALRPGLMSSFMSTILPIRIFLFFIWPVNASTLYVRTRLNV